jgi:hypothetical protein
MADILAHIKTKHRVLFEQLVKTEAMLVPANKDAGCWNPVVQDDGCSLSCLLDEYERSVVADKLEQIKKAETELHQVKKDNVKIEAKLNETLDETKKTLDNKNVEIEALKTELSLSVILRLSDKQKDVKIVQLKATIDETKKTLDDKNVEIEALKTELSLGITEACDIEKDVEIVQLKATIDTLSNELTSVKATCNIVFEDQENKECKCLATMILNKDLQEKVEMMKGLLGIRENEIKLKVQEISLLKKSNLNLKCP